MFAESSISIASNGDSGPSSSCQIHKLELSDFSELSDIDLDHNSSEERRERGMCRAGIVWIDVGRSRDLNLRGRRHETGFRDALEVGALSGCMP